MDMTQSREAVLLHWMVESEIKNIPTDVNNGSETIRFCVIERNENPKLRLKKINQIRGWQTTAGVPNPTCCSFYKIRFCWNTAMLICLCNISGCFHATMPELSSCPGIVWSTKPKIFAIGLTPESDKEVQMTRFGFTAAQVKRWRKRERVCVCNYLVSINNHNA